MPSRLFTLLIVVFWLFATGLFVAYAIWPRVMPSEPLMFPVDIIDEAGQRTELVNYNVSKNHGQDDTYRAEVEWSYHPEDDSFESKCTCDRRWTDPEPPRTDGSAWLPQIHEVVMNSSYSLARNGEMQAISVKTTYLLVEGESDQDGIAARAEVMGPIRASSASRHASAVHFPI